MQIMGTGIIHSTGKPLIEPIDEQEFAVQIRNSLSRNREEVENLEQATSVANAFRGEVEAQPSPNLNDPLAAGWTFLVNGEDPEKDAIIRVLRPLAEHRGMDDPDSPLIYNGEQFHEWADWLAVNYSSSNLPGGKERPHYILIVGDPDRVPFQFQSFLDSAASVGRVDFDRIDRIRDLETYVEKLITLESAESPAAERKAVCFAPDGGCIEFEGERACDPTHYSRHYMGERFAEHIRANFKVDTTALMADNATKEHLLDSLIGARPALVFTASHGAGEVDSSFEIQKELNGAIVCQDQEELIEAKDLPRDEPFLEGAVYFQFACFGYGTPGVSHSAHWLGETAWPAHPDFVAAVPKKLLAHPHGPVAFVGHVDTAFLHGFTDPHDEALHDAWHPRIGPYIRAINSLLGAEPVGRAMVGFNERYYELNDLLTKFYDDVKEDPTEYAPAYLKRGKDANTPAYRWLVDTFILRTDAQDYMIFGDPATHIRIPGE